MMHQIESGLYQREGQAVTNFAETLPAPQSDLTQELIKDPYNFDFLTLTEDYNERELEKALTDHITKFLLELDAGLAYVGRQKGVKVGERELILTLAMQGRLVEQDPNDPPASELLKEIEAEKQRLIKKKDIGQYLLADNVSVAKKYLTENEMAQLQRLISAYLDI